MRRPLPDFDGRLALHLPILSPSLQVEFSLQTVLLEDATCSDADRSLFCDWHTSWGCESSACILSEKAAVGSKPASHCGAKQGYNRLITVDWEYSNSTTNEWVKLETVPRQNTRTTAQQAGSDSNFSRPGRLLGGYRGLAVSRLDSIRFNPQVESPDTVAS